MKRLSFKRTLSLLALSGAIALPPQIAFPRAAATSVDPNTGQPELHFSQAVRFSLEITEGVLKQGNQTRPATVANVMEALRTKVPAANFVLSPGVSEIVVSNLTLREVNLDGALEALGYTTGNKVRAASVGKDNVYAVILGQAARPEKGVEAFNLMPTMGALGARDSEATRERVKEISTLIIRTLKDFDDRTQQQRGVPWR